MTEKWPQNNLVGIATTKLTNSSQLTMWYYDTGYEEKVFQDVFQSHSWSV